MCSMMQECCFPVAASGKVCSSCRITQSLLQAGLALNYEDQSILTCTDCRFDGLMRISALTSASVHLFSSTITCNHRISYEEQLVGRAANVTVWASSQ